MKRKYVAVIQAGGRGTRMEPLTRGRVPKPMLRLNGKPLVLWQVECLRRHGLAELIVILGPMGEQIRAFLGDGSRYGLRVRYVEEREPLGTGGSLCELPALAPGSDFFLAFGDVMFDIDIPRMLRFHEKKCAEATILVHPNAHPEDSDLVVMDEEERVVAFAFAGERDDGDDYDNCVHAGIGVLSGEALAGLGQPRKLDLERDVLSGMLAGGAVYGYRTTEYVKDAGTPERFRDVAREQRQGIWAMRSLRRPQRCIFLDRDGTINVERGLIARPEDLALEEGAAEAIRRINASGYLAVVVTNQPVVARGLCTMAGMRAIHRRLCALLGKQGAYLDDLAFCPHHPDKGYPGENPRYKMPCACRKPETGMIEQMARRHGIDLAASWIIGDRTVDVEAGKRAGLRTALVATGQGGRDGKYAAMPDLRARDLRDAVEKILGQGGMALPGEDRAAVGREDCCPDGERSMGMGIEGGMQAIEDYLAKVRGALDALPREAVCRAMRILEEARLGKRGIFICGNGGSAATASHFACDLARGASQGKAIPYRVECLSDNVPAMMAVANDISYEDIFVVPLRSKLEAGDVVIGISGSGNSENVVRALSWANRAGARTIAVTGYDGGRLKGIAQCSLHVPVNHMQVAEDLHLVLSHLMMSILRDTA